MIRSYFCMTWRAGSSNRMLLIEDDYESEINFEGDPSPALKSLDENNRVIYIGSLTKTLSPGLRLGYMVGPAGLIREARALRRLMIRHPPRPAHAPYLHPCRQYRRRDVRLNAVAPSRSSPALKTRW